MNSNDILVSLDIGTSSVKVIIGEMVNDTANIIGVGNVPSRGLKKGSIVDIDDTVHSIKKAIEQAERMVGMEIHQVVVGVSGNHVMLQPCHGVVAVSGGNREITNEDVTRVIDAAQVVSIPPEREIIDVVPRQFIVDGLDEINDPRGMIGVRLEMEGSIITCSKTILHNILRCVERAGLEIVDISLQPLAAGFFALSKDEKNLGVALIDIGGGSTTVAVFEEGDLMSTFMLPVGGDHLAKDLSIGLKISTEDAEKIIIKHGHTYYNDASEEEMFTVPIIGSNHQQTYNQLEVADILEARMEETFELVDLEMKRLGYPNIPGGYVLTGGVANLQGILELAQDVLNNRVRIAIPDYIGVREPQYTTAVGLIHFIHQKARVQGKQLGSGVTHMEIDETEHRNEPQIKKRQEKTQDQKVLSKVKKVFRYLFDE